MALRRRVDIPAWGRYSQGEQTVQLLLPRDGSLIAGIPRISFFEGKVGTA